MPPDIVILPTELEHPERVRGNLGVILKRKVGHRIGRRVRQVEVAIQRHAAIVLDQHGSNAVIALTDVKPTTGLDQLAGIGHHQRAPGVAGQTGIERILHRQCGSTADVQRKARIGPFREIDSAVVGQRRAAVQCQKLRRQVIRQPAIPAEGEIAARQRRVVEGD